MEIAAGIFVVIIQVIIYLACLITFLPFSKETCAKATARITIKVFVFLAMFFSFLFVYGARHVFIFPAAGFEEYMILTLVSSSSLWLVHNDQFITNRWLYPITNLMLGICFWMSLLTSVKFIPILAFSLFPLLGGMVIAPYFVLVITIFEINRLRPLHGKLLLPKTIIYSLAFLIVFQLLMNCWSDEPWELIRIFTLDYKL